MKFTYQQQTGGIGEGGAVAAENDLELMGSVLAR
jgi:hypothetical protein